MNEINKENIILEIAKLVETDVNAKTISLDVLRLLDIKELEKIKQSLLNSKKELNSKSKNWLDEIAQNCSKD
jgi:hypothetical protein